jgi:hypothetical protein
MIGKTKRHEGEAMPAKREKKHSKKTHNLPERELTRNQAKAVRGGTDLEPIVIQHEGVRRTK